MHPVIDALLDVVERDPFPEGYTSSYWHEYGAKNTVGRQDGRLILQPYGIGTVERPGLRGRAMHWCERLSYWPLTARLRDYPSVWQTTKQLARDLSCGLTFDVWKFSVILWILVDHWRAHQLSPRTFAMIGDGHGFLGALIRRYLPGVRLYCIDLPKTLVFQAHLHERAGRGATMAVLSTGSAPGADVTFVLPQDVERIAEPIDCAINIASMQEMNAATIRAYFAFLRRRSTPHSRFYCANRVEKVLPGGEMARFHEYPWHEDDDVFLDGPCPYYRHFLSPERARNGPTVFGRRVPLVNYFDGIHRHRLVRLAPLEDGHG